MSKSQLRESLKTISDYKYALDQADIVAITDTKGSIKYVNDNFCKISGYNADELIGRDHRVINSGYHSKEFIANLWATISSGKVWKGEIRNKAKDGRIYWVDTTIVPFLNTDGVPYQYLAIRHDITQRKAIENELVDSNLKLEQRVIERSRESENRRKYFKALIENVSEGLLLMAENGAVMYQNPAIGRICGYRLEDLYEKKGGRFIHPDDLPDFISTIDELGHIPGGTIQKQYRIKHKQGHYLWIEGTISNQLYEENIRAFIFTFKNVTDRKNAEAEILVSKQFTEGILASLTSHIAVIDQSGVIITVNKAWQDFAKESNQITMPRSAEGANYFELLKIAATEGNTTAEQSLNGMFSVLKKEKELFELRYFCQAPAVKKWFMLRVMNFVSDTPKLVVVHQDITSAIEAEENFRLSQKRFQALIEKGSDVIVLSDADRKVIYASPTLKAVMGYEPDEIVGKYSHELLDPEEITKVLTDSQITYKSEGNYTAQLKVPHKNGSWRWIEVKLNNQLADPAVNAIVTNFCDITDRKLAEDEVKSLNESLESKVKERTLQLQEVNKELESFSYTVAHDLRAPLRVINGFADLLMQEHSQVLEGDSKYLLECIAQNSQQMGLLINGLLEFSRLGRVTISPEVVEMQIMVDNLVKLIKDSHKNPTAAIKINDLPSARCDANLIKQVWLNLVENAIKYSGKVEHPVIEIGGRSEGSKAIYYIRDNGAGFNMELAQRLFQVFQRLHSRSDFEGNGIGLALSYRIITKHGGEMWAEGEVNKGATFYFSLPA
jgi:PAS domain S-box-containing protein